MRLVLLTFLASLTLPIYTFADLLFPENIAGEILAFNLCKIKEGRSRSELNNEAKAVLEQNGFDSYLLNQTSVKRRANKNLNNGICKYFKGHYTYRDFLRSNQNQSSDVFNRLTKVERQVVKEYVYGFCMYQGGKYSYDYMKSYVRSQISNLATPENDFNDLISLLLQPKIHSATTWLLGNIDERTCMIK